MHEGRVEFILAHSDPLDVANAIEAVVEGLSWEMFYEVASRGRTRLAGTYRDELNEVLALDPPYVREEFSKFLQRNPRALVCFGTPLTTRITSRLQDTSPPFFGEFAVADRRVWWYAGAVAAAFVLGVAITVILTHSRAPLAAASHKMGLSGGASVRVQALRKQQPSPPPRIYRRNTDEVVSDSSSSSTAPVKTDSPKTEVQQTVPVAAQPTVVKRSTPAPPPPNGKGDAVVAVPAPSPTATPDDSTIDAENDTPVWRKGTVNVQASPADAPSVQDDGVPHEAKAIPIHTATPTPPKPKATQKPGLVRRVLDGFKGPKPSPSSSP